MGSQTAQAVLTLTAEQAAHLGDILLDLQTHCASQAQNLERLQQAPNAAEMLWLHASFIADIRGKLGK